MLRAPTTFARASPPSKEHAIDPSLFPSVVLSRAINALNINATAPGRSMGRAAKMPRMKWAALRLALVYCVDVCVVRIGKWKFGATYR